MLILISSAFSLHSDVVVCRTGSDGKTMQQKTVPCHFQKAVGKDLGLVINEEMYICDGSQAVRSSISSERILD